VIIVSLVRYLAGDVLRAGRWVAPGVLFLILTVSGTAVGGTALGGYGFTATALLPIAIWVTITVLNSEDPIQTGITTVAVGSALTVRLTKLAVAFLACQFLTAIGVLWPLLTGHRATASDVLAGLIGHLLSSLAGVAFGGLLSRPLLRAPAWAVIGGIVVFLLEILIPGFPPVRPIAVSFSDVPPTSAELFRTLGQVAAETVIGAVVLIGLAQRLAQRRT